MKQLRDNKNRIGAIMAIVALAVGSVSIVGIGTTHMVKADQVGKVCVFFACGNANITGGTTSSGGGGGGGQPTPSTATLIVTKTCPATQACRPEGFTITVTGNNPSPDSFKGSATGTTVTLDPGVYNVNENPPAGFTASFSGDCKNININAGETKKCTVTNTQTQSTTATLKVIKQVVCPAGTACKVPSDFLLKVTATNANPSDSFLGSATGTQVTLDAGSFTVTETGTQPGYVVTFKDDCAPNGSGNINAGQSLTCTVVNTLTATGGG